MVTKNSKKNRFKKKQVPKAIKRRVQAKNIKRHKAKRAKKVSEKRVLERDLIEDGDHQIGVVVSDDEGLGFGEDHKLQKHDFDDLLDEVSSECTSLTAGSFDGRELKNISEDEKRRIINEQIESHKRELEKIKDEDAEYYKYLLENERGLLEFANEEPLVEQNTGEESQEDVLESSKKQTWTKGDIIIWKQKLLETKNLKIFKKALVTLWESIDSMKKNSDDDNTIKTTSAAELMELLFLCLKTAPIVFKYHLFGEDKVIFNKNAHIKRTDLMKILNKPIWGKLKSMVKSYVFGIYNSMKIFSTNRNMKCYILTSLSQSTIFFHPFNTKLKKLVHHLSNIWINDDERISIRAFYLMKSISNESNNEVSDMIISSMLHVYYAHSNIKKLTYNPSNDAVSTHEKNTDFGGGTDDPKNNGTDPVDEKIDYLIKSIIQICASNPLATYKVVFLSIRTLALFLRNCITKKDSRFYTILYHHKTIKKIVLISNIISVLHALPNNPLNDDLKDTLLYPFSQVCFGILRIRPPGEYTPFHLHIIRSLINLSQATNVFIPVSPYLFNALETPSMLANGTPSTAKPLDFPSSIKVPNDIISTRQYNNHLARIVSDLLTSHFSIYSKSISFPELIAAPVSYGKNLIKKTSNSEVKSELRIFIAKMEDRAREILKRRSGVQFGPCNVSEVETFFLRHVHLNLTQAIRSHLFSN